MPQKRKRRGGRSPTSSEQHINSSCSCSSDLWSKPKAARVLEGVLLASSDPRHDSWNERSGRIDGAKSIGMRRSGPGTRPNQLRTCQRRKIELGVRSRYQHGEEKQGSQQELSHHRVSQKSIPTPTPLEPRSCVKPFSSECNQVRMTDPSNVPNI